MGTVEPASGVIRVLGLCLCNKAERRTAAVVMARRRVDSMAGKYMCGRVLKGAANGRKRGRLSKGQQKNLDLYYLG